MRGTLPWKGTEKTYPLEYGEVRLLVFATLLGLPTSRPLVTVALLGLPTSRLLVTVTPLGPPTSTVTSS